MLSRKAAAPFGGEVTKLTATNKSVEEIKAQTPGQRPKGFRLPNCSTITRIPDTRMLAKAPLAVPRLQMKAPTVAGTNTNSAAEEETARTAMRSSRKREKTRAAPEMMGMTHLPTASWRASLIPGRNKP